MKQDYPWIPIHYQRHTEDLEIPRKIQSEDCGDNLPKGGKKERRKALKRNQAQMNIQKSQPF